ncbi:MAG TPA: hypothetical protein VKB84_10790 [Candidatus Binataceae bacterium]|jgi:hypothetical protein|nr:hypothetical protein [Candidatus Binataceae bacterium]
MLISSMWIGLGVLATILMAANWYIWEPRYRTSDSYRLDPADRQVKPHDYHVQLPTAA